MIASPERAIDLRSLARIDEVYNDPLGEARRRFNNGNRLIGYFLNTIPVELIIAAGLDPIRLTGERAPPSEIALRYLEEYHEGEVPSIFQRFFDGSYDPFSLIVIPRSSESYRWMYYTLKEVKKLEPRWGTPEFCLFDLLQSQRNVTFEYVLDRTIELARRLSSISGKIVNDQNLGEAITKTNRLRAALRRCKTLWNGATPLLSGSEALKINYAASVLHIDEAIEVLTNLANEAKASVAKEASGPRVMLKGSDLGDTLLTSLIESSGGKIVGQDHSFGDLTYNIDVRQDCDPFQAVAAHYQRNAPSARIRPQASQDVRFIELATEALAEGVIFYHAQFDDSLGWDFPNQKALLASRGISSLVLERHSFGNPPVDALKSQIMTFISSLGGQ